VIPLFILGGRLISSFCFLTGKIMDSIKIRVENRCNAIDPFFNERLLSFSGWPCKDPEQLQNEDSTAEPDIGIFTLVRELGRTPLKRAAPNHRRSDLRGAGEWGSKGAHDNTC
jgi:hypothetical protein